MYYPLTVEEYQLIGDSGGPGKFRGGMGIKRKYRVYGHDSVLTVNTDWRKQKPDGLNGGWKGSKTKIVFNEGTDKETIPAFCKVIRSIGDGETFTIYTGGGNGFGDPREREREKVVRDLKDDKISVATAMETYHFDS